MGRIFKYLTLVFLVSVTGVRAADEVCYDSIELSSLKSIHHCLNVKSAVSEGDISYCYGYDFVHEEKRAEAFIKIYVRDNGNPKEVVEKKKVKSGDYYDRLMNTIKKSGFFNKSYCIKRYPFSSPKLSFVVIKYYDNGELKTQARPDRYYESSSFGEGYREKLRYMKDITFGAEDILNLDFENEIDQVEKLESQNK